MARFSETASKGCGGTVLLMYVGMHALISLGSVDAKIYDHAMFWPFPYPLLLPFSLGILHQSHNSHKMHRTSNPRQLRHDANRHDLQRRRHARWRLKAHPDEQVIRDRLPGTEHQDLRRPRAARQLPARNGTDGRVLRRVRVRHVVEVQELHRLPVIRHGDQPVLGHDEVPLRVEREDDGLGARGAVEADQGTVAVVELGVGAVQGFAVQDDARVLELEDECREGVCALGDGGGWGEGGCGFSWGYGGGGDVRRADTGAGARVADGAGTG